MHMHGITKVAAAIAAVALLSGASQQLPKVRERVQAPSFVDECGHLSDTFAYTEPATDQWHWAISLTTNEDGSFEHVVLRAVANEGYAFRGSVRRVTWDFTWDNDAPC
jgi:hypothetical protein